MKRARLTKSKLEKAIAAVAAACGSVPQVVIEPDGTIRITPLDRIPPLVKVDRPKPVRL